MHTGVVKLNTDHKKTHENENLKNTQQTPSKSFIKTTTHDMERHKSKVQNTKTATPKTQKSFSEATFKKIPQVSKCRLIQIIPKRCSTLRHLTILMQTSRALHIIQSSAGPSFQSETCGCEGSHLGEKKQNNV